MWRKDFLCTGIIFKKLCRLLFMFLTGFTSFSGLLLFLASNFFFILWYTSFVYWDTPSHNSKYVHCIKITIWNQKLIWKNNEQRTSKHKPSPLSSTHITIWESVFKVLLSVSPAADPSTTVFSFFIFILFLQLLFHQLLFLLLSFTLSPANC